MILLIVVLILCICCIVNGQTPFAIYQIYDNTDCTGTITTVLAYNTNTWYTCSYSSIYNKNIATNSQYSNADCTGARIDYTISNCLRYPCTITITIIIIIIIILTLLY